MRRCSIKFATMDAAFDLGINFLDTADAYSRWVEGNPAAFPSR